MALSLDQYHYRSPYGGLEHKMKVILSKRNDRQRKRSPRVSFKIGNWMPEQILIEILSRLPVKDLLQFKSVCKLWYGIIKSPHFISKHLENYYNHQINSRECLLVQYATTQAGELTVYQLLVDNIKNKVICHQEISTLVYNTYMCGPCNGIYYLWCFCFGPKRSLWNPTLNEFEVLPDLISKPNLPSYAKASSYEIFGFGFDVETKDYKVVGIHGYWEPLCLCNTFSIFVYSLRANSWRFCGDLENYYHLERSQCYDFVNGCYYWGGCRRHSCNWHFDTIISFDFTNDIIMEIPMPEFEVKPYYGSQLIVYDDSIAFVYVLEERTEFYVWTWKNEVWTHKLTIDLHFNVRGAFSQWRDTMLVFRKYGGKLILCDTNTKETWVLNDPLASRVATICAYKESLVSIKDFKLQAQQEVKIIECGLVNILSVKLHCDGLL